MSELHPIFQGICEAHGLSPARMARCTCGETRPSSERDRLAFFEDRSPGSKWAEQHCRHCGCYAVAHEPSERWTTTGYPLVIGEPHAFEAHDGHEFDSYYCGHGGWD